MKVRFILVEADDVNSADVGEIIAKLTATNGHAIALPTITPPALTQRDAAIERAAASVQLAKTTPGWRPSSKVKKKYGVRQADGGTNDPKPDQPKRFQCADCGNDADPTYKRRPHTPCEKCGKTNWEIVGGQTAEPVLAE